MVLLVMPSRSRVTKTDWEIYGMDLSANKLDDIIQHRRFHFLKEI